MPESETKPARQRRNGSRRRKSEGNRNALKHGIMSPHPVIIEEIETVEDWEDFRDGIVASLAPEGAFEQDLAESIALTRWRLKRVTRYETDMINHQVQGTAGNLVEADAYISRVPADQVPEPDERRVRAYREIRLIPTGSSLGMIMQYEPRLHRLWVQTLHELQALQARRMGQAAPLMRFSFSGPPS